MPVRLVRHTRLAIESGVCYGASDIDVAPTFASEAAIVTAKLNACDNLITSPLQRCTKLAAQISARFGVEAVIDNRLIEMDFGSWEGRLWSDIPKQELDGWADDFLHARPHGGESVAMLRSRTHQAIADYQYRDDNYVVVCHAGVIRALLSTGDSAEHFGAELDYGEIVLLDVEQEN